VSAPSWWDKDSQLGADDGLRELTERHCLWPPCSPEDAVRLLSPSRTSVRCRRAGRASPGYRGTSARLLGNQYDVTTRSTLLRARRGEGGPPGRR